MRADQITMNGTLLGAQSTSIASAGTTSLSGATGNAVPITGTATITSFGSGVQAGARFWLTFAAAATVIHNGTSLIMPAAGSHTMAAGDVFVFESLGSGNWKCVGYCLASGEAIVGTTTVTGLIVDNSVAKNPVIKPVHSFFNGVPGASENVAAGYIVGRSRVVDYNTQIEYLYLSGTTTAVWEAQSGDQITLPTWAPTFTPDGAVCTSVVLDSSNYVFSRQGNAVTLSLSVVVSLDFSVDPSGAFTIDPATLPIPSTAPLGIGVGQVRSADVEAINCYVNNGTFSFLSGIGTSITDLKAFFTYQYSVN